MMSTDIICRAVLFDLDGVIVFTDTFHYLGWKRLTDEEGWRFDEEFNNNLRGVSRLDSLELILDLNGVERSGEEKQILADRKNRYYVDLLKTMDESALVPGALSFLEEIRARNMKTALCSSSRNAGFVLDRLGIRDCFDAVVTGADISKSKPDPEIFFLAAMQLGIPPENCIVVEDAPSGIEAALQGGMKAVGFGTESPHASIQSFTAADIDGLLAACGFKTGYRE